MEKSIIQWTKTVGVGIGSALCYFLGGWDVMLELLVTLTVLDFITGVIAAVYNQKLSSEIGYKGIVRKIGIYVIIAMAVIIDNTVNAQGVLRGACIGFYIAIEGMSILENWGKMGLPLPDVLKKALAQLKDGVNKEDNGEGKS